MLDTPSSDVLPPRFHSRDGIDYAIGRVVSAARSHFGMDVAFVSEFVGDQRVFRVVDAGGASPVQVGGSDPLEASYCQRVLDGRLPEVLWDASASAEALTLPVTTALPVGAHLSVPIRLADGQVYGTFCCFKTTPDPELSERDGAVMHLLAGLVASYIDEHLATQPTAPAPPAPATSPVDRRELNRLQAVGWPAAAVLVLCTMFFSLEHLAGDHVSLKIIEDIAAVAGLVAVTVIVVVAVLWRTVSARLLGTSAELARRDEIDRAGRAEFNRRRDEIVAVLEASDAMRMVFQPIFDLETGNITGHEALARFSGELPPDVWFSNAHDAGLGVELELLAVTEAIKAFDATDGYLAVNLSPAALRSGPLQSFLDRSPDASRLVLELTEHAVIHDYASVAECVERLRARGARLAVDDAGSGFASMRHILDLTPDIVKLDRSLIDRVDQDAGRAALVASLVAFARSIGATVVAEGLERDEELDACRRLGVDCGQGYLLGRPTDAPTPPGHTQPMRTT